MSTFARSSLAPAEEPETLRYEDIGHKVKGETPWPLIWVGFCLLFIVVVPLFLVR